ncbi:MAG: AsmA-like C-terminal region-containing protein [Gallionellaceae bacterium]|nr:AsmA-like C-terminal region-containing protein [Gallionellaceae bacterium]
MSFADSEQIYISRPYYDFVSRLNDEYADLFQYRGQKIDKHGREHQIYELVRADVPLAGGVQPQIAGAAAEINLEPFSFTLPEVMPEPEFRHREEIKAGKGDAALLDEIGRLNQPESKPAEVEALQTITTSAAPQIPEPAMAEEPEKPVAEARMPSEEEVRKAVEQHSKIWEKAEQRAVENAKAIAERANQPQPEVVVPPAPAKQRKLIPWGKVGAALFVLMLILLFAVPFVLPMQGYATRIEQHLSTQLKQPVHIGQLSGRLLPMPRLELSDVSIGEKKQIQAQQARVDFAFSALFSSARPINVVALERVQVDGAALPQVSSWLQQAAADRQYPVARILLDQGMLETNSIKFADVGGELKFDQDGKFSQAKLHAEQGKYELDINAAPENKLLLSAMVRGNAFPLLPDWVFDELNVKGELKGDSLQITSLDGHIHDGKLSGEALIDWRSGWRAQGTLNVYAVDLKNVSKVLVGNIDATVNFLMQSPALDKLAASAAMNGSFVINKGTINGMDIVETVRLRSRENLPGGRTHFDQLSGNLSIANGEYHFRQLKIDAGVLKATGAVDVVGRSVSGKVSADLAMRADMGPVSLQVGGASDNPTLRAVR